MRRGKEGRGVGERRGLEGREGGGRRTEEEMRIIYNIT